MFVVTGPTGNVGNELASRLVELGDDAPPFRLAAHHPERARRLHGPAVPVVHLDYADPTTLPVAFEGITTLFLLFPLPHPRTVKRWMIPAIDAAVLAGVRHIVYVSVPGADKSRLVPHAGVERHLASTGVAHTILRPAYFMQNLVRALSTHGVDIADHDEVFVPAGNGKTSFLDSRDLAEIVISIVRRPYAHAGRDYVIPGPDDLDFYEAAVILSEVLGRQITYTDPSRLQFWRRMRKRGVSRDTVFFMQIVYTLARRGWNAQVGSDLRGLLDREPTTFRQFAEDYKWRWDTRTWT